MGKLLTTDQGKAAIDYHSGKRYDGNPLQNRPGKIGILTTKGCDTQEELSLAYTPYVGACVEALAEAPGRAPELTGYGNRGAVISDGTAILGYGDLGPKAAMPVMEGKSILFKVFGDVNMDAIVIAEKDPDKIVALIMAMEPTYAGINLEDISAPRCFEIERKLQEKYDGFIFHDDQHGTAVISLAGLWNALELGKKDPARVRVVVNGAGASAVASARLYRRAGIKDIVMLDSNGVIYCGRPCPTNVHKEEFSRDPGELGMRKGRDGKVGLAEAIRGADVFVGCSVGGVLTKTMVKSMAKRAIVMAMANPIPEIYPEEAKAGGAMIVATGRSDYPNQINNVLGFPGIFRGALDALTGKATDEMKLSAARALASLARRPVPEEMKRKYPADNKRGVFSGRDPLKPEYIVPLALDMRVPVEVAAAVYRQAFGDRLARAKLPAGFASVEEYLPLYKKKVAGRLKLQEKFRKALARFGV